MFETLSHLALQQYWWIIISLLGAILVFLMFVQGGQTLIYTIGKTKTERTILVNALGRKWEFTFTTLVTFGGAFFASFPLFYSTSFGGAYWIWMIILFAFTLQAVSYEYRNRPGNVFGARTYETFLFINGLIGTIFLGTAVATFFTGSEFSVNALNQSQWEGPLHGLELALNPQNLALGLAIFFLARVLGLLYFMNSIDHPHILQRTRKHLAYNAIPFLIFFITFTIWLLVSPGFAVDEATQQIYTEPFKYIHNFIEMPIVLILFLAGIALILAGITMGYKKGSPAGIWLAGPGTILTVLNLLLVAGLNNTAFYPSTYDLQSSLTIQNASSGKYTLTTMSYVSLLVPFIAAYIWYAWRAINNKKITSEEISSGGETHFY